MTGSGELLTWTARLTDRYSTPPSWPGRGDSSPQTSSAVIGKVKTGAEA
eukprot:CAMPEP_0184721140 /NCGR_PEP_ID=MMETSP0314-20130426/16959_1 /TAXON_ID=38298 /ORGANISM="Rhodella maculata, Strain CCMP 736" /LENGTH=48 /DNA_ID= /DNA_START= /DNA_END= /DNA_ORIENTATION=